MSEGRDAWRKALAEHHKAQRRGRVRRKAAQPGPGMIRRPPPGICERCGAATENRSDRHCSACYAYLDSEVWP